MTKKVLIAILAVLLIVVGLTSCNDGSSGGKTDPKRPATLSVSSFTEYYPVGAEKPSGSLLYTSTDGKITSVGINDEGVTHNFDAKTAGEGKLLKITYNGIDAAAKYNVVEPEIIDITGTFIVEKNATLTFKTNTTTKKLEITKEEWANWSDFYNLENVPESKTLEYTIGISPAGGTVIRVNNWSYSVKDGGLAGYPSEGSYFEFDAGYTPNTGYYYVSTAKEDHRSTTNVAAHDKYLVMKFNAYGNAYFWFTDNVEAGTLNALSDDAAIIIPASQMAFDNAGLNFKNVTVAGNEATASNLAIILNKDGYASKTSAFGFVSSDDGNYRGYSYTMKLTDIAVH